MFCYVDIGDYGRQGDAGIFTQFEFGQAVLNRSLPIPLNDCLAGTDEEVNYCFMGDEAFPLKENLRTLP